MPRWPEVAGHEVVALDGWSVDEDGPPSDDAARTFRLRLRAGGPAADGEEVVLRFGGLATLCTVSLNDTVVLESDAMFAEHVVEVGALLTGDDELVVRCAPLTEVLAGRRKPRQRWRTKLVAEANLRFVRTALHGRCPGFSPGPPIVGPWRPAQLERRRRVVVDDVALRPSLDGAVGAIDVRARVRGITGHVSPSSVAVVLDGPSGRHEAPLALSDDGLAAGVLAVTDVARWWPHTHGEPVRHDVSLWIDGEVEARVGRVGFRELSPGPDHDVARDSLALAVNGTPVFVRGAVWTPVDDDAVRPTLEAARDAGLNLVRLAGTGTYGSDAFHDACDELGMLVWQDFMYANLDYPIADPAFRATVEAEACQELARIAGRPSLAVLCGNSEVEQQAAMFGVDAALGRGELFGELLPALAREAGLDVPYVPSAPCGGDLPFHPSAGVANYFGVGGYRRPLRDARTAGVRFASECLAVANVPDGDVADGEGVARDVDSPWDFADVRDHYLRELYGVDPEALRTGDRTRYLELSRAVSGELLAHVFGEWRRATSPCSGGIVLWLRDVLPGAGWGLLDDTGAPKPVTRRLAQVLAPTACWIVDEGLGGLDVHVAHDGAAPLQAELHVALLADGQRVLEEATAPLALAPHSTTHRNVEGLLGRFADASYAYRFGPPAHDTVVATLRDAAGALLGQAVGFPLGAPVEPRSADELGLRAARASVAGGQDHTGQTRDAGSGAAITLEADRVVHAVRVHGPGATARDDLITVVPGTPRTVHVAGDPSNLHVSATNLAGTLPVPAAGH